MLLLSLFSSLPFFSFLYGDAALLRLHSFPTRRSSDLSILVLIQRSHSIPGAMCFTATSSSSSATVTELTEQKWQSRSEEHTSELQSRQYLVCRLLLEKKNATLHDETEFTPAPCMPACV